MIRDFRAVALAFALALLASPAPADEPTLNERARDVRDLRDAALSPDARQLATVIGASTAEGGQTHLWLLGTDGKSARQVTVSGADTEAGERAPGWSADGSA